MIVEQSRLDAAVRSKQPDPRISASHPAMLERLFVEARRYAVKRNVIDLVEDRSTFISSGVVPKPTPEAVIDVKRISKSVRLVAAVQAELSLAASLQLAVRYLTTVVRNRAKAVIHPIEDRVKRLLYPQHFAVSKVRAKNRPDYGP